MLDENAGWLAQKNNEKIRPLKNRFYFLVLLLILLTTSIHAQYYREWTQLSNCPNGTLESFFTKTDSNGNTIVAQGENLEEHGILITKYDRNGTIIWQQTHDSFIVEAVVGLELDNDGNIYILLSCTDVYPFQIALVKYRSGGTLLWQWTNNTMTNQTGNFKLDPAGYIYVTGEKMLNQKCITHKFDLDGNLIWTKEISLHEHDSGNDLTFDIEGNIYVGFQSGVVAYSASGLELWHIDLYPFVTERIILDNQNNVIVTGYNYSQSFSPRNIELKKINNSGVLLWSRTYNGNLGGEDYASNLIVDNNNNIYLTGACNADYMLNIMSEFILLRYDSAGNNLFTRILDGSSIDGHSGGYDITIGPDGYLFVSGYLFNTDTKSDAFICKMDLSFNILWQDLYPHPGNNNEYFAKICFDQYGNIYLGGETSIEQGSNWAGVLITKYCNGTCVDGMYDHEKAVDISIYPNPATTELTVVGYNPASLKLCNTLGQTVAEAYNTNKIWIGNLPQGLYLLQVFDKKGGLVRVEKVVKE